MAADHISNRSSKKRQNFFQRWIVPPLKLALSPVVMVWDSFREKRLADYSWLYAYFILTSAIMCVAFLAVWITDGPVDQTLKMLSTVKNHSIPLEGDVHPLINRINQVGLEHDIDPNLIFAVIQRESNFNPKAVSRAGARGLMQLTPFVWKQYSGSPCSGTHPNKVVCTIDNCIYDPGANLRVGVKYLRVLLDHYQGRVDLALEAYNAGLTNVTPGEEPKFGETRHFLKNVFLDWHKLRQATIGLKLEAALHFRHGIKQLFGAAFICWVILFWWANRKLFPN